ncbi:MAG: hypothetical protein AAF487_03580 [Bacteroidota bacterium]
MRLVENIPHHTFSISLFDWNGKYILKIEHGLAEQVYKFNKDWVSGLEDVKKILTEEFLLENLKRFNAMHESVKSTLNQ